MQFPFHTYERLAERILAGEVVFFVGAGFSLDSEGNSADRLMGRLLARFEALTRHPQLAHACGKDLQAGLRRTFQLENRRFIWMHAVVKVLSKRYYDVNDWMTNAFEILATAMLRLPHRVRLSTIAEANRNENILLRRALPASKRNPVPLAPVDAACIAGVPRGSRGKALFLETLGFADQAVMAGEFERTDLSAFMRLYRGLIRDRQRVIVRLAREGLCPIALTTNYDLLLEGAARLAGFAVPAFGAENPVPPDNREPPATYAQLTRIAAPADFFRSGAGFRSALLVKLHGCADRYRVERRLGHKQLCAYLPSVVFTYREIQNWRRDSWSRDLVATLLRTRTMVLCGYSGADPVLHDAFRTVYEEIGTHNIPPHATKSADKIRAYFTGRAVDREFHGLEILRAASRAAGIHVPPLTDHENYLPFYFQSDGKFPTVDEMMIWLMHRTMRGLQRQALKTDLRRIASHLLNRRVHQEELEHIHQRFETIQRLETSVARAWNDEGDSRWQFGRIAGWTDRFHSALLREFVLAETVQRNEGPGLHLEHIRAARCYFPVCDQPGWAAWGVVIEIALRRMLACLRCVQRSWMRDYSRVEPAVCEYPAVLFSSSRNEPSPSCLLLRCAGFERSAYRPEIRGVYKRLQVWELASTARDDTPDVAELWVWATAPNDHVWDDKEIADAKRWLGETRDPARR